MAESTKFLADSDTWSKISAASARERRGPALIAVPWVTAPLLKLRRGDEIVLDASEAAIKSGQTNPQFISEWMGKGVKVYSLPQLHAKVFLFGSVLFVGSTNVSRNSDEILYEAVLQTSERTAVADARAHVKDLIGSGERLHKQDVERLAKMYQPAGRFGPLGQQAGESRSKRFTGDERVFFVELGPPASAGAKKWVAGNERSHRRRAGLKSPLEFFEVNEKGWSPDFHVGDLVVRRSTEESDGDPYDDVFPPAVVVAIEQLPSLRGVARWVILLDEKSGSARSVSKFEAATKRHRVGAIDWQEKQSIKRRAVGSALKALWPSLYETA
jgi:hypothetical protein